MKTRVIPNEVRDLSKARGSRYVLRVIRSPLVRSLGVLGMTGMTAWVGLNLVEVKAGDVVTVEASRAKDGSTNANARAVTLASTGQRLFAASSQASQ